MQKSGNEALIGFVGQGYVGGNYADDFEKRGFKVVRYSLEPEYSANKDKIQDCDVVFICTPTPTTPEGSDVSAVKEGVGLVADGKIAVIKSTILPGTTKKLQELFPKKTVLFSPEFLSVVSAADDVAHPFSSIVGTPVQDETHVQAANLLQDILPKASFSLTCDSTEAEIIKYAHNINGFFQIILGNLLYDIAQSEGVSWNPIQQAIEADPYISNRYSRPVHKSGRGAGGACFIKDFAAFSKFYRELLPQDTKGGNTLTALEQKNIELLIGSNKDLELIKQTYGEGVLKA